MKSILIIIKLYHKKIMIKNVGWPTNWKSTFQEKYSFRQNYNNQKINKIPMFN
jgi:hypothetical protein